MHKKAEKHSSTLIKQLLADRDPIETAKVRNRMLLAVKIYNGVKTLGWNKVRFAQEMGKKPSVITKWLSGTHNFTQDTLTEIELKLEIELLSVNKKDVVVKYEPIIISQSNPDTNKMGLVASYVSGNWYSDKEIIIKR